MVDGILKAGVFPNEWKIAKLVLIPKPGKKDAYRPICLLSTLAKAVEIIVDRRLQGELEERGLLSDRQYGFRQGRSTLMAIERVMRSVERDHDRYGTRRDTALLILLDVKNAFNSVEWRVILEAFRDKGVSAYLRRLLSSYLRDRSVKEGSVGYAMTAGVPQGSVLGPTLWNAASMRL